MNVKEALEILPPPEKLRLFLREAKCDAHPVLIAESLEWLNAEASNVSEEQKRQVKHMNTCLEAIKKETKLVAEGNVLLQPTRGLLSNIVPVESAKEAAAKYFYAGYAEAIKDLFTVSQKEEWDLQLKNEALDVLASHIENLRYTFSLDTKGNLSENASIASAASARLSRR